MGIPININDLLNSNIIESSRIEYKADYNPNEIMGQSFFFQKVPFCRIF